ncbi:HlyD family secretion protein [Novosphingobium sp. SG751A]|uniref:efflux RND transporter periplasmic adaptor subunit n=1 Tax=Novosphingobium sp. SG751A TaxID=2587000 RepID=UPI0015562A9D|nr:efflux RND transporter periplasmic adaptor subunit [Novosphingobium sp. SG751A]NOW48460.1 HlyD family secretion protein [Novosphingobium sp. SG751A]
MRHVLPVGFLALLTACSSGHDQKRPTNSPRAVFVAPVRQLDLGDGLVVSGRLVSREEAAVTSQLSNYPVSRVLVDQGAVVRAGQPLAMLDDTLLKADIAQQRASVMQAEVAAQRAQQEAERVSTLDNSGVLSGEVIAERRLAAKSANAQLAQARAQLSAQLIRQKLMVVRAPVGGIVLSRSVRPGDVAAPSSIMFTLATDRVVELDAEIPEQNMNFIKLGDEAKVILATGETVTGKVRLVSAQVDASTRLGRARVTLPVRADLRPGGFAKAEFRTISRSVRAVPEAAVTVSAEGSAVIVVDGRNVVHRMGVTLGRRGRGLIELMSGPKPGERVLTGSQDFVLSGDTVKPVADAKWGQ